MRNLLATGILATSLTVSTPALASDTQYWQTLFAYVKVADKVQVIDEVFVRTSDAKGFYEVENGLMLGYKPVKNLTLAAGWVYDPQYSHGTHTLDEHRLRTHIGLDKIAMIGPAKLSGRVRFETRWREGFTGTAWRMRPYFKLSLPVQGKTTLNLTNETFVNFNRTGFQKVNGLDLMRSAILLNTPIARHFNLDIGYLNQHGFVRNGPDTSDNVVMTGITANF